jgi:tripartite motif-containing protein 71
MTFFSPKISSIANPPHPQQTHAHFMHNAHLFSAPNLRRVCGALLPLLLCLLMPGVTHAQRMPQDSWYLATEFRGQIEPGAMNKPGRVAVGPDGNLYVTERSGNRIQVFDAEGKSLRTWGSSGSQPGQFQDPVGIAITGEGIVYVCEWGNHRVQAFDLQGKFLRAFAQYGSGAGQLNGPHGITVDREGNVYVCEHSSARVSVFSPSGAFLRSWGSSGLENGQFNGVIDIRTTADNKIAVLERDGYSRIQIFDTQGKFVSSVPTYAHNPHGLSVDASGNFYVLETTSGRVSVYSSAGVKGQSFGTAGAGDGQFANAHGLTVANGKVFVCDHENSRIAVFDTNGYWIKNFGYYGIAEFGDTHGIAVDASGNIYISDYQHNQIRKFDAAYNFVKRFGTAGSGDGQFRGPGGLAVGPNQFLYVVDCEANRVQIFDLDGNFKGKFGGSGSTDGMFNAPYSVGISKTGTVFVSDRNNHRIQAFDLSGNLLFKFGRQGSFYGEFSSPHGVAVSPGGNVAVADANNERIQIFDGNGGFLRQFSFTRWEWWHSSRPYRLSFLSDGLLCAEGVADYGGAKIRLYSISGELLKEWDSPWASVAETPSGDLIGAHGGDRVVRVWKRTYRLAQPEPGNAIPLPLILSQKRRPGTSLVDVEYTVKDGDNITVQTAALAFKNGGNSLYDLIPITSFAEGTESHIGGGITTGQTHRFTWDVTKDWATDFGEVQLEILAKDSRGLLNLDFLQIPATQGNSVLKISRSPLNDNDFLSVWYWLIATGDPGINFSNGVVNPATIATTFSYDGSNGVPGLKGTYYSNQSFSGTPITRVDQYVNIQPAVSSQSLDGPFQSEQLSVEWSGLFIPNVSGQHQFYFTTDDGVRVWVNEQLIIDSWHPQGPTEYSSAVNLTAGVAVPIRVEYFDRGGLRAAVLSWQPPGGEKGLIPPTNLFTGERASAGSISFTPAGQSYANGTSTTASGRAYLFNRLGLREATPAEVLRAKEAGTPGVINQWEPKNRRVGPDERPAKVNSYGFDTGADGFWVVPVTK